MFLLQQALVQTGKLGLLLKQFEQLEQLLVQLPPEHGAVAGSYTRLLVIRLLGVFKPFKLLHRLPFEWIDGVATDEEEQDEFDCLRRLDGAAIVG